MREAEGKTDCLQSHIRLMNQPQTVERPAKMGDRFLEHFGAEECRTQPENRSDDVANSLAHRWIDLEGAPKQSAPAVWAGDLVSLQLHTQRSWVGAVPPRCHQRVLQEKVFRVCFVTRQPSPERQNRARGQKKSDRPEPCPESSGRKG